MNFEELYKKYKDGTATEEEKAFVESEIEKARAVSSILDGEADGPTINEADSETVRKAKKAFNLRTTIKTITVTVICIVVIAVLGAGAIFGTAYFSANGSKNLTKEEATEVAENFLREHLGGDQTAEMIIGESETELDIGSRLTDSVYVYEINIISGDYCYQVEVSSKTGYAVITDKESLDDEWGRVRSDKHVEDKKPETEITHETRDR